MGFPRASPPVIPAAGFEAPSPSSPPSVISSLEIMSRRFTHTKERRTLYFQPVTLVLAQRDQEDRIRAQGNRSALRMGICEVYGSIDPIAILSVRMASTWANTSESSRNCAISPADGPNSTLSSRLRHMARIQLFGARAQLDRNTQRRCGSLRFQLDQYKSRDGKRYFVNLICSTYNRRS